MVVSFEQGAKRRMRILARLQGMAHCSSNELGKSDALHIEADSLLCEYLEIVGATDLVAAYKAIINPEQLS